jgi:hypothetical protein
VIPLLPADLVAWIARDALGLTFLLSASGKLRDVVALVIGVLRYEIGPPVLMRRLAPLLPLGDLLLAALLVTGVAVRATGQVATRVVPRDLTDLEDMLDRIAVAQDNRPWMPVETPPRYVEPEQRLAPAVSVSKKCTRGARLGWGG